MGFEVSCPWWKTCPRLDQKVRQFKLYSVYKNSILGIMGLKNIEWNFHQWHQKRNMSEEDRSQMYAWTLLCVSKMTYHMISTIFYGPSYVNWPDRNNATIASPKYRGNPKSGGIFSEKAGPNFYTQLLPPLFTPTFSIPVDDSIFQFENAYYTSHTERDLRTA